MIVYLFLISFCALSASAQSIASRLAIDYDCSFNTMTSSFNATGMNAKINGTKGPYTILALCDDIPVTSFPASTLNYHLLQGIWGWTQLLTTLPADGLITTEDAGKKVRITSYAGGFFVNGKYQLSNASDDYYSPAQVTNGAFYRLDKNIVTDTWSPASTEAPNTKTVLEGLADFPTASTMNQLIGALSTPYIPPVGGWTLLVPVDTVFLALPIYQQEALINSGSTTAVDFVSNHAINGVKFAAPLSKVSRDNSNIETTDSYTSVSGKTYPVSYDWQQKFYYVDDNKKMTNTDNHYADGVIHLIDNFLYFDEIAALLPPPTFAELVAQYDTFSYNLKKNLGFDPLKPEALIDLYLDYVKSVGVTIPNEEITVFCIADKSMPVPALANPEQSILYLIIPGQFDLASLPLDTLIDTYANAQIRINSYDDGTTQTYWVNGLASVIASDIKIDKATIHVIETSAFLEPACSATATDCVNPQNWKNSTIAEELESSSDYTIFWGLLQESTVWANIQAPYTLFVIPDYVYTIQNDGLVDYLKSNVTELDKYIQKLYVESTIYPNVANGKVVNVATKDGLTYAFLRNSDTQVFINEAILADAIPTNDGIYYESSDYLFTTSIPAGPVPPVDQPTAPIPDPLEPEGSSSQLVCMWSLFFVLLAVLFS